MKIEIHSFHSPNVHPKVVESHQKVFKHFGLDVKYFYTQENPSLPHNQFYVGKYYDHILKTSEADIFIFVDIDAVPLYKEVVEEMIEYVKNDYMIGVSQITPNCNSEYYFYCAPAFMGISKKYYESIGSPSFMDAPELGCDIAQLVTKRAIQHKKRMKFWFPDTFQSVPRGGLWKYGFYGYNGIGSIYENKVYHLFESRFTNNAELFEETCNLIIEGKLDKISRSYNCREELRGKLPIHTEDL
jgi:hypothetical protein